MPSLEQHTQCEVCDRTVSMVPIKMQSDSPCPHAPSASTEGSDEAMVDSVGLGLIVALPHPLNMPEARFTK